MRSIKELLGHFNFRPEPFLLLFILLSNAAIVANWYFDRPEKVTLISKDGVEILVQKWAVNGHLDKMILKDKMHVEFYGWTFDARNSRLPDEILLSYDGENIYSGQTNVKRPDVARMYGDKALTTGFRFLLPLNLFKEKKIYNSKIRLFAVSNGVASELSYFRGFN